MKTKTSFMLKVRLEGGTLCNCEGDVCQQGLFQDYQNACLKQHYCRTHNVHVCLYIACGSASLYIKMMYFFFCSLALSAAATIANIKIHYDAKTPQFAIFGTSVISVFYSYKISTRPYLAPQLLQILIPATLNSLLCQKGQITLQICIRRCFLNLRQSNIFAASLSPAC